jgi:hypothetical protein
MSPLELIFKQLDNNLRSIHCKTELLEACDWDEDELENLLGNVSNILSELSGKATQKELESDVLLVALRERLRLVVREDQIDIIMRLLRAEAMLNDTQGLDDG